MCKLSEKYHEGGGGSVGEDDEDRMGGEDDIFLNRIREALVQRISQPHPTQPNIV